MIGNIYLSVDGRNKDYLQLQIIEVVKNTHIWTKRNISTKHSSMIYLKPFEIFKHCTSEDFTSFDFYNYFQTHISNDNKIIRIVYADLNSSLKTIHDYTIPVELFRNVFETCSGLKERKIIKLKYQDKKASLVMQESKNLPAVLGNKLIKRKFVKALNSLLDTCHDKVVLYDDFVKYSFGFAKYIDGKRHYNGGLICHKDYNNPDDIAKMNYSVHT